MEVAMSELKLTPEQEAEAQRLADIIAQKAKEEALQMARLLVSKSDHELLGATEFEIRERVHKIGACALETAVNQRKKGGTQGRA
jgi:plasmid stabilization system protein ParE